jgi:hypothetical protein
MKPDAQIATPIDAPCQNIRFVLEGKTARTKSQGEEWQRKFERSTPR